jgi:hypothetical protein
MLNEQGFVHNARGTYVCLIFGADWWVLIRYSKSVVAINGNLSRDPRLAIYEVMR